MSVYPIKYKVLNRETGRKVTVTRWRVQIRQGGENISKVFDDEDTARFFEDKELKRIKTGIAPDIILDMKYQAEMPSMAKLLKDYLAESVNKLSETSHKTNKNRCESAIPSVKIYMKDLGAKFGKYRYNESIVSSMLKVQYTDDFIPFGEFKIDTVDFWLLMAYMESRRKSGIKDNTILREISIISSAFERVYRLYPQQFPDGLMNPTKMLPKGEKPKPYLGRKRVVSDDEAARIAEWLKLKTNQEPFYLFVICLESGARKSEVLGIQWEHVNFKDWTIFLPRTKNGKERTIMIPDDDDVRDWLTTTRLAKGPVFKLTAWNFRQYWVDALKALGMYDDPNTRLHFHDTRRTKITKVIRQGGSNSFQVAKEMGMSPQSVEQAKAQMPDSMNEIFAKLRRGEPLNEEEIMKLAGHGSMAMTNAYYGDRN